MGIVIRSAAVSQKEIRRRVDEGLRVRILDRRDDESVVACLLCYYCRIGVGTGGSRTAASGFCPVVTGVHDDFHLGGEVRHELGGPEVGTYANGDVCPVGEALVGGNFEKVDVLLVRGPPVGSYRAFFNGDSRFGGLLFGGSEVHPVLLGRRRGLEYRLARYGTEEEDPTQNQMLYVSFHDLFIKILHRDRQLPDLRPGWGSCSP